MIRKNWVKCFPHSVCVLTIKSSNILENINWRKCIRHSFYGVFISAPILFGWIKIVTKIWPKQGLLTAVQKAVFEQVSFGPASISLFFFTMGCFDNNFDFNIARDQVKKKFWDAYKVCKE